MEKEAENISSLSKWIKKQKPSPCEPVQQVSANFCFFSFGFQFSVPLAVRRLKELNLRGKEFFVFFFFCQL